MVSQQASPVFVNPPLRYRLKILLRQVLVTLLMPFSFFGIIFGLILFTGQLGSFGRMIAFHQTGAMVVFTKAFFVLLASSIIAAIIDFMPNGIKQKYAKHESIVFAVAVFLWVVLSAIIIMPAKGISTPATVSPPPAPKPGVSPYSISYNRVLLHIVKDENQVTSITGKASISSLGNGRYLVQLKK